MPPERQFYRYWVSERLQSPVLLLHHRLSKEATIRQIGRDSAQRLPIGKAVRYRPSARVRYTGRMREPWAWHNHSPIITVDSERITKD